MGACVPSALAALILTGQATQNRQLWLAKVNPGHLLGNGVARGLQECSGCGS
jgi:hypothetical protein